MSIQYVIRRGDSLWALAGRHLGNPNVWPELQRFHNEEVLKTGGGRGKIFKIQNPDLIYVGQILFLPVRDKKSLSSMTQVGARNIAKKPATPIELKVQYVFGNGKNPVIFRKESTKYNINIELSGTVEIEISSSGRHQQHLELIVCKGTPQCKNKLNELYTSVVASLFNEPEVELQNDRLVMTAPFGDRDKIKSHIIDIRKSVHGRQVGNLELPSIVGTIKRNKVEYKYTAQIGIKVDVYTSTENRGKPHSHQRQGFYSAVGEGLAKVGSGLYDTFTNKEFQKGVADGFIRAGKVAVLVHTAVTIKAAALHTVAMTPAAALPVSIENAVEAFVDGYMPGPPSTIPGGVVAITIMAVDWALSEPPWEK